MIRKMQMVKARQALTRLPEELKQADTMTTLAVTRKGEPVLAILPWELYEGIVETLEILGDAQLMKSLTRGFEDLEAGRILTTKELKRSLRMK